VPRAVPLIGAHVSVAGGLARALPRIESIGAAAAQIFVANPRGWAAPTADPDGDAAFGAACPVPVYVHAPYLINFGSPSDATLARSGEALEFSLRRGAAIGARGVVMHAGSAVHGHRRDVALKQAREAVLRALDAVPDGPALLIEPTAGGGGALAADAATTAEYVALFDADERLALCLDTCHLHAAGHDLSTVHRFLRALRAYQRAAPVALVHVNDSRDPVGSRRDRHETLGRGTIGTDAFGALFRSPVTRRVPLIVETEDASHPADIAILRRLHASVAAR
jgi:deoxyribonuclease-4